MASVYDVRCDRCGESGSIKRMDIKSGICIYCREERGGTMPEDLKIARMRRFRDFSVERLQQILKYHQTMIDAIKEVLEERKEER